MRPTWVWAKWPRRAGHAANPPLRTSSLRPSARVAACLPVALCSLPVVAQFASPLRHDLEAVKLSITTPWSDGPIGGYINRPKAIKRQMYRRSGLELLRASVLPWDISRPIQVQRVCLGGMLACDLVVELVRLPAGLFHFELGDAFEEDPFKLGKVHGIACCVHSLLQLLESDAERFYHVGHGSQSHSDLDATHWVLEVERFGLLTRIWSSA